jgi:ferritin-like metal-binding protein YciE
MTRHLRRKASTINGDALSAGATKSGTRLAFERRRRGVEHAARLLLMHRAGSMLETRTLDDLGGHDMEGGLHAAFIDELRDAYDAEKQLLKALPKLAKAATAAPLRTAFLDHLEETRGHVGRLEQVFSSLDEKARGKHCDGIAGIIEEGKSVMEEELDGETLDACLIAAGQRSEHYEMAAYGTLVAWAEAMGHNKAAQLLNTILAEEKAADEKLTSLAKGGINDRAAAVAHDESDDEQTEGVAASIKRALFGGAKKRGRSATRRSPVRRTAKKR